MLFGQDPATLVSLRYQITALVRNDYIKVRVLSGCYMSDPVDKLIYSLSCFCRYEQRIIAIGQCFLLLDRQ